MFCKSAHIKYMKGMLMLMMLMNGCMQLLHDASYRECSYLKKTGYIPLQLLVGNWRWKSVHTWGTALVV